MSAGPALLVGFGAANLAVARQLAGRGCELLAADDNPDKQVLLRAQDLGVELLARPAAEDWDRLAAAARVVVPSPGLPDAHPVHAAAQRSGTPMVSELDLAALWDTRPVLAVTGTNGKTTVTRLVAAMLEASGVRAVTAGNTETPLVEAIADPRSDVFVVEASSFRLGHSRVFRPNVATWLNFSPDHLDVHASLDAYEKAKASLWARCDNGDIAVANLDDPVVMRHVPTGVTVRGFSLAEDVSPSGAHAEYRVSQGALWADDELLLEVSELRRALPHDLSNALAATATALAGGATLAGVRAALRDWQELEHRVQLVVETRGVRYYDDSKATTPHATLAAVAGLSQGSGRVVLIAGGQNKGLDLSALRQVAPLLRAVVAIGDAADEVRAAFSASHVQVTVATCMAEAVTAAAGSARPGDAVLLSPACASFDWYSSYAERGDDFARQVQALLPEAGS